MKISGNCERRTPAAHVKLIGATALAAMAVCAIPLQPAHARVAWPFGSWWDDRPPPRQAPRPRHVEPARHKDQKAETAPRGPLQIIISVPDQRVSVYDNGALLAQSVVSTGVQGHPTPLGIFAVIGKQRWHESNIYSAAPMPYMQRITWSGIALHAGVVPGHPASHGCIRLKNEFAIRLWNLTKRGTRVIIAPGDTRPVEMAHAKLFAPEPKVASGTPAVPATVADNSPTTVAAVNAAPTAGATASQASDAPAPGPAPAAAPPRKPAPITVFVSRKTGKLYVRQAYTPLFDTAVSIREPEKPLGTHVFTVMRGGDADKLRWTVVSMPERAPAAPPPPPQRRGHGKHIVEAPPPAPSVDKAAEALDRIDIPAEAVTRISELLTPGSAFIVSDHGISPETGSDTDFIVETR